MSYVKKKVIISTQSIPITHKSDSFPFKYPLSNKKGGWKKVYFPSW